MKTELERMLGFVGLIVICSALLAAITGLFLVALPVGIMGAGMLGASRLLIRRRLSKARSTTERAFEVIVPPIKP